MNRSSITSFLSAVVVLIIGLLIGFVILVVSNPGNAAGAFSTMITFGFRNMRNVGDVLLHATPIILTGLSVAFAYKTGLFNIGAAGQFTIGAFVAIYISVEFTFLPPWLRILTAVVSAAIFGAMWGAIPGLLKAYRNVHEVISCIMTNYIAMFLTNYLILNYVFDQGRGTSAALPRESNLPSLGFDNIFREQMGNIYRSSNVNAGIVIAIAVAILIYVILEKTTFGYELKACGFNKDAAKYAGINQNRNIVFSMMICGALAGIGGALTYMSGTGLSMSVTDTLSQHGFTGISVAFLGLNHPIGVIFSGALVSYLSLGGTRMQPFGFSPEFVDIVVSIIIYFCAFVFLVKSAIETKFFGFGKKEGGKTE